MSAIPIDIDFLRSYPQLQNLPNEKLRRIVKVLGDQWIDTSADLESASREDLEKLPLWVLSALKPLQQQQNVLGEPAPKRLKPSAAGKTLPPELAQMLHDLPLNTGSVQLLREDWDTKLPTSFRIGAVSDFGEAAIPEDLLAEFSQFVVDNDSSGNRRGLGSVVAMPGWGKTFSMDLLAQLPGACRSKLAPQGSERLSEMWDSAVNKLTNERKQKLASCVPLAITLNSNMSLQLDADAKKDPEKSYDSEIAKRLMYAFFGNLQMPFPYWVEKQKTDSWTCRDVLLCVKHFAQQAMMVQIGRDDNNAEDEEENKTMSPLILLLIDEPNHEEGASIVLRALSSTALDMEFDVDCRVVMTSLEQKWLFREVADAGRPIKDLRLAPPQDKVSKGLLIKGLEKKVDGSVPPRDLNDVANYVVAVAGGHWRTLSKAYKSIIQSNQLSSASMKESVGRAKADFPNAWTRNVVASVGQLEEALAHSILGSKLFWMEPLHTGTAWQAIAAGVIRMYLGTARCASFEPAVPLLAVLRLSEGGTSSNDALQIYWNNQGERRSALLVQTLALARFFPSRAVSSETAAHELYENLASHFMLLKWDAFARINAAVRRRWRLLDASDNQGVETLLKIPGGLKAYLEQEESKRDPNYNSGEVAQWRNAANEAWSLSIAPNRPTPTAPDHPYLWLVPPNATAFSEFDLRLHVFRGATCCTKFRAPNGIQVLPPDPSTADIYKCTKKLFTKGAAVESNMVLSAGSGIEPAKGNDGFDSLFVLQKRDSTSMFALIENKYEKNKVNTETVTNKLTLLKKYRGELWQGPGQKGKKAFNVASLRLPNKVKESDIVWVLLADNGWVEDIPQGVENWLRANPEEFLGHVLLTTSEMFFGPSFKKVNLLQRF